MEVKVDFNLLKNIPNVLRARGFRLYLANGGRLVDLWLNGGAAILGHTPPNLLRELKNTASRGLYAPFPHFTEGRYLKALSKIFPERSFRLYAAPPPELYALFNKGEAKLWRPFTNPASPFAVSEKVPVLIPVLPGIQLWRESEGTELPFGLCVTAAESEKQLTQLPPGDMLSPVQLAVAARGLYDILASPERAKPVLPRTLKVCSQTEFKNSLWRQEGIYLSLKEKTNTGEWTELFNKFLEAGFLLPPNQAQPIILPGELSDGEDAKLAAEIGKFVM
jgi:hypothetical protein